MRVIRKIEEKLLDYVIIIALALLATFAMLFALVLYDFYRISDAIVSGSLLAFYILIGHHSLQGLLLRISAKLKSVERCKLDRYVMAFTTACFVLAAIGLLTFVFPAKSWYSWGGLGLYVISSMVIIRIGLEIFKEIDSRQRGVKA